MHFRIMKEKKLANGKYMVIIHYLSFLMDSSILIIDCEAVFGEGKEIKQIVNGRVHYASCKGDI